MWLHTTDNEHIESRVDRFQKYLIMNHTGSADNLVFKDFCLDGINRTLSMMSLLNIEMM